MKLTGLEQGLWSPASRAHVVLTPGPAVNVNVACPSGVEASGALWMDTVGAFGPRIECNQSAVCCSRVGSTTVHLTAWQAPSTTYSSEGMDKACMALYMATACWSTGRMGSSVAPIRNAGGSSSVRFHSGEDLLVMNGSSQVGGSA
jgi:hypothetical protein